MVQLEKYMVTIGPTAPALDNFQHHRARYHVASGEVLGIGCIAFHEAFAVLIDQVAALTPAPLGDQHTGTVDTGGVKLPHFDVLHRKTSPQGHANTVAGIDVGIGGRGINAPRPASGEYGGLGFDVNGLASLHAYRNDTHHGAILVFYQIGCIPLIEEDRIVLHVALIQGVQQGVAGAVRRSTGAGCLASLTIVLGLAAEGALVDPTLLGARKRQAHVLKLEYCFGAHATHVLYGVLVADIVGALYGVIHMPAPVVFGVGAGNGTGDPTLGGYRVRAGGEHLGDNSGLVSRLGQLQGSAHTGTATTDDNGVKRESTKSSHNLKTPQDLDAPDDVCKHDNGAEHLREKA